MIDFIFALCIILMPILLVGQILLWYRQRDIMRRPTNIIIQRFGKYEWLIYLWFSVGIMALLCTMFQIDHNSIALRKNANTSENILSIIITFLVAWQIWQTITSKQTIEKLQEENSNTKVLAQLGVNDTALLCTAMIAAHEGLEAWLQRKDAPTAYAKYVSALNNYILIHSGIFKKDEAIKECEKRLNEFLKETKNITNKAERKKFKKYAENIEKAYDLITEMAKKVEMPNGFIDRLTKLNKERKELLRQWGY